MNSSNSSFVPVSSLFRLSAHFILRWPAQNGPMTHFVPRVIAEVKITWMWKPLEPIGHSQKVVTGSHTQEGQRSPHPGTFPSYINAESDKQDRKCREGKARLARLAAFQEKKKIIQKQSSPIVLHTAMTWSKQIIIIDACRIKPEPDLILYFKHFPLRENHQ